MHITRLLPLLYLLSLSPIGLSQDRSTMPAVPNTCPVTKPASSSFVPPRPYPAKSSVGQFWFGTYKLWTVLPVTGVWRLGHYSFSDPTFRQKVSFWRQGYDPQAEPRPNLTVSGRRIDASAGPLQTDGKGNGSWTKDDQFIMTGINFPTAGCWEITGRYENDELAFVVWVSP
jgi:hypothetical protein